MKPNRPTGGGADRMGRVLVVESCTTTEDLLEDGALAATVGDGACAATDVAYLAPEPAAEAEGLAPAPAHAKCRLGYRFVKRAFDIAFSLCVIVAGLVPGLVLSLAIAMETKGSPIYTQERVGKNGKPFRIFKFRTMVADSDNVEKYLNPGQLEEWAREHKVADDPRITSLGKILRATSVDEFANFLNVLAGQMSVVGPRAIVEDEVIWFGSDEKLLLSVRPGVTGWWQVRDRNEATYESGDRQKLELHYVEHASLLFDARIFLMTFKAVLNRTGK